MPGIRAVMTHSLPKTRTRTSASGTWQEFCSDWHARRSYPLPFASPHRPLSMALSTVSAISGETSSRSGGEASRLRVHARAFSTPRTQQWPESRSSAVRRAGPAGSADRGAERRASRGPRSALPSSTNLTVTQLPNCGPEVSLPCSTARIRESASPPKADMLTVGVNVCKVPLADINRSRWGG